MVAQIGFRPGPAGSWKTLENVSLHARMSQRGPMAYAGPFPYARHGPGGNYSWVDGHVSMMPWRIMSQGGNGFVDWYYMKSPQDRPN